MGYYDFPHTRNYDSDLGFLIKRYNEVIERIDGIESTILSQAKDYTDAQLRTYQDQLNRFRNEIQGRFNQFTETVNANITLMQSDIARFDAKIDNAIIGVNARTDLAIEQNNEYLKEYIADQVIDVKVLNYFTGDYVTVQEMLDYLAAFHATGGITYNQLATREKTYTQLAALEITYTELVTNGYNIIV